MSDLKDYLLLSFDVYGTLIDWETGVFAALQRTLFPTSKIQSLSRKDLLSTHYKYESAQQAKTPDMPYSTLLTTIHPLIAKELGLDTPTSSQSEEFGKSIGTWPAFPDTVDALKRLHKFYKLVVLSNVDRESFSASNSGPLQGFPFDKIITAQDVGSYKPDHKNFNHMIRTVKEEFGVHQSEILQTAQSQFHDHRPAREIGLKSAWIVRSGAVMGNREEEVWDWKFDTLGEMADAVEKEFEGARK